MSRAQNVARHRVERKSSARFVLTVGGMLASTSAIAGASIVAVIAAGGTYALWTGSASASGGTVRSGSLSLTVNDLASYALPGSSWSNLLPGDVVRQSVSVKNTGNVSGEVSALTTGNFGPLLVQVARGLCTDVPNPIVGTSSSDSATDLGEFAAGEASAVCLQVTLPSTVADTVQGSNQDFTVTFTATTEP